MTEPKKNSRLHDVLVTLGMVLVTLVGLEIFLRVADFKEFRESMTERSLGYAYDAELGWAPVPNSTGTIKTFRTTQYKHNSMGLRDEELRRMPSRRSCSSATPSSGASIPRPTNVLPSC